MSQYVRRCADCETVRGMTAFRVVGIGERHTVCRWCEERDRNVRRDLRDRRARVQRLVRQESELLAKLREVRDRLAKARHALKAQVTVVAEPDEQEVA